METTLALATTLWSILSTTAALGLALWLVDDADVADPWWIVLTVVFVVLVDAIAEPVLRRLAGILNAVTALVAGFAFQLALLTVALRVIPGVSGLGWRATLKVIVVMAVVLALARWILGFSQTAYVVQAGGVSRKRRAGAAASTSQGLLIVQLDGVSPGVMRLACQAGRAPNVMSWLQAGTMRLTRWWACLPSTTPATMAGILHGDRSIPAFRWWDRELGRMVVTNRPADAAHVEAGFPPGTGLTQGGAAISTMFSGGAETALVVMSQVTQSRGLGPGSAYISFFARFGILPGALVQSVGEMAKELYQSYRQRLRNVQPRVSRFGAYVFLRGITNVAQRKLNLALVADQMTRGAPVIYVNMLDYDEIAHHAGPLRPEAMDAVQGLDEVLGHLQHVAQRVSTRYELVVLSDHGQSLGPTFEQVSGTSLPDLVKELMDLSLAEVEQSHGGEEWGVVNTLVTSALPPNRGKVLGPDRSKLSDSPDEDLPEVAVIASGSLAMVWFPRLPRVVTLGQIDGSWPALIPGLLLARGMGLILVQTSAGPVILGPRGSRDLVSGRVDGEDPLTGYPSRAEADLRRLSTLRKCGDLVILSAVAAGGMVHAFEDLVGSHGGLGGEQSDGLLIHPAHLTLDEKLLENVDGDRILVGAWQLHKQLLQWRDQVVA